MAALPAQAAAQGDPSNVRVTIDYRAAPAADVIAALAAAAGVSMKMLATCAWDFDPERGRA